jgi:hypothetical protein
MCLDCICTVQSKDIFSLSMYFESTYLDIYVCMSKYILKLYMYLEQIQSEYVLSLYMSNVTTYLDIYVCMSK